MEALAEAGRALEAVRAVGRVVCEDTGGPGEGSDSGAGGSEWGGDLGLGGQFGGNDGYDGL